MSPKLLRRVRLALGLSQTELGESVRVDLRVPESVSVQSLVSEAERGVGRNLALLRWAVRVGLAARRGRRPFGNPPAFRGVLARARKSDRARVEPGASLWDAICALDRAVCALPADNPARDDLINLVVDGFDLVGDAVGSAALSFPRSVVESAAAREAAGDPVPAESLS